MVSINDLLEEIDKLSLTSEKSYPKNNADLFLMSNTIDAIGSATILENPVLSTNSAVVLPVSLDQLCNYYDPNQRIEEMCFNVKKPIECLLEDADFVWKRGMTLQLEKCSVSDAHYDFISQNIDDDCLEVEEVEILPDSQYSAEKSMSMLRKPGAKQNFTRGKSGNLPFLPGGLEIAAEADEKASVKSLNDPTSEMKIQQSFLAFKDDDDGEELPYCAPGMSKGIDFIELNCLYKYQETDKEGRPQSEDDIFESISVNPKELLKPYGKAADNQEKIRDLKRIIQANQSVQAIQTEGSLTLQRLLQEDDDDKYILDSSEEEEDDDLSIIKDSEEDDEDLSISKGSSTKKVDKLFSSPKQHSSIEGDPDEINNILVISETIKDKEDNKQQEEHEWAITKSIDTSNFALDIPNMAISYPFELDKFQKEAILHLERHESVFIAAHTSAGKTVIAEYAIAMSAKHMTKSIYTSPIKALSNQKYRDFKTRFGTDVGLITGDVSINPTASCLIMTTEILRSMLYRGADLVRDIEWVIFDEIHYINDTDRGVVWEEVIIMLPEHVSMIFLSATTPNTFEFSDWIGRTKKKKIHVISTTYRPVPLQHYLYCEKTMHKIMDQNSNFLSNGHKKAMDSLEGDTTKKDSSSGKKSTPNSNKLYRYQNSNSNQTNFGNRSQWTTLMKAMEKNNLLPVVVFAFSKATCEKCAESLNKMDFSSHQDKSDIHLFTKQSIKRLQGSDQELPQVLKIVEMLKRGIGVHHGGLLPILKEMIEILFSRGLVKVLFATETFAMGVNMPARTVIFNGIRKHDGRGFRYLLPGEYTQMAGRAGRRGLDSVGTVLITCWDKVPLVSSLQTMLAGTPTKLESQFRLTYNMIVNLLRAEDMTVEDMIKRSFSEFRTQRFLSQMDVPTAMKKIENQLKKLQETADEYVVFASGGGEMSVSIREYFNLIQQSREASKIVYKFLMSTKYYSAVICPGRIVVIHAKGLRQQLAVVLRVYQESHNEGINLENQKSFTALVLCPADYEPPMSLQITSSDSSHPKANSMKDKTKDRFSFGTKISSSLDDTYKSLNIGSFGDVLNCRFAILQLDTSSLDAICGKMSINATAVLDEGSRLALSSIVEKLINVQDMYPPPSYPPELDPIKELKINDLDFYTQWQHAKVIKETIQQMKCSCSIELEEQVIKYEKIRLLEKDLKILRYQMSSESLALFPDFVQRLKVLQLLGYIDKDKTVQLKGRVACEINTCDELILTELIFENVLSDLSPEEAIAVLSALIFQSKTKDEPNLSVNLQKAKEKVLTIANSLAMIQLEAGLEIDPKIYAQTLNFGLMEVVYEWARGMSFKSICLLTTVQEGLIVRCINRLDEVCREVRKVASVIGDPRMFKKMEIASEMIKRDVIFATSLYLT